MLAIDFVERRCSQLVVSGDGLSCGLSYGLSRGLLTYHVIAFVMEPVDVLLACPIFGFDVIEKVEVHVDGRGNLTVGLDAVKFKVDDEVPVGWVVYQVGLNGLLVVLG